MFASRDAAGAHMPDVMRQQLKAKMAAAKSSKVKPADNIPGARGICWVNVDVHAFSDLQLLKNC